MNGCLPTGESMKFIPNECLIDEMLKEIGVSTIDELFTDIPSNLKVKQIPLPKGKTQQEVEQILRRLAQKNTSFHQMPIFLGGGVQFHYIPALVSSILGRSEFFSSYTPYQAEASQGFLQAMFEYQSMIANITGMEIANASLYDGVTALGEAALMSYRITKRSTFYIPQNISWEKRSILQNYVRGQGIFIKEVPYEKKTGLVDLHFLEKHINEDTAGVYIENPNYFGIFEQEINQIQKVVSDHGSLFVVGTHPLSLGIVRSPGEYGADIVIGEGQSLGNPVDFGGSTLGIFATKQKYLRHLPGRIIGMTTDNQGKPAFCMTMQTREQHIRRGRATSNICTNEGLNALAATVYLSWLGSNGLYQVGKRNLERAYEVKERIIALSPFTSVFQGDHFNEFVVHYSGEKKHLQQILQKHGVQGGLPLESWFPELKKCYLFCVTELHTDKDIEVLLKALKEA